MNTIKTLNKDKLKNLGGVGYTRPELLNSVIGLYNKVKAVNMRDFRKKSVQLIPRIELKPKNDAMFRKAIKTKYNIKYLKNFEERKRRYIEELNNRNFEEILRVARQNDGFITFERDDEVVIYNINERNQEILRDMIAGVEVQEATKSDMEYLTTFLHNIENFIALPIIDINEFLDEGETTRSNPSGGFLPYVHNLDIDLTKFGFFQKGKTDSSYHDHNCLYHALKAQGLDLMKLNNLNEMFYQRDISLKTLRKITEALKINMLLTRSNDGNVLKMKHNDSDKEFHIGLIEGHYFSIEPTLFTRYVIENYEAVKNEKNYLTIVAKNKDGTYSRKKDRGLSSKLVLELVIKLHSEKLGKMDALNTVYHTKLSNEIKNLEYIERSAMLMSDGKLESGSVKREPKTVLRVFFDFETCASDINTSGRKDELNNGNVKEFTEFAHDGVVCCCRFVSARNVQISKTWKGYNCGEEFIKYVLSISGYDQIHLIAHNAGFDLNQIIRYLPNVEVCKIGSRLIFTKTTLRKSKTRKAAVEIIVKDSMNFISMGLSKFHKMFKFEEEKAYFDHSWIKAENFDKSGHLINKWIDAPLEPIKAEIINGKFDLEAYFLYYCEVDVIVLEKGYNTFNKWLQLLGECIDDFYTISSVAKNHVVAQGCFEGCYQLAGIPQHFINLSMFGGRVMCENNNMIKRTDKKKWVNGVEFDIDETECKISTLDANSLYPSACTNLKGFVKGKPNVIEDLSMDFLNKQDHYVVEIEITKVGKKLKMPLLCVKHESSIEYTNNVTKNMVVGKQYLEDLIKFQEIEFNLIRGYYFNDGFNDGIIRCIKNLYETRNELVKEKNPAEAIYKLIMNSIYGKCLQKPRDKRIVIKESYKDMIKYLHRNQNNVEMVEKMAKCDKWMIREYQEIDTDYNNVHIGCQILDASKHIMNELIVLAEDNKIDVLYTDTDSLHLDLINIPKLEKLYMETYNKPLIHDNLCGFKMDFNKPNNGYSSTSGDIYAKRSIFLGKKSYIDNLNTDKDYIRLKGITLASINYKCLQEQTSQWDIYNDRFNGKPQIFDLTCGGNAFTGKQKNNFTFVNINNFTRVI